jgi:DNA-binding beta-propeller fold protein YncE
MNPKAESIKRWLSGTRQAIHELARRGRVISETRPFIRARLARPALLILVLAITAGVPVPASARGERDSRMFVHGAMPAQLQGWQPRTVNPLVQAPHSAAGTWTLGPVSPFFGFGSSLVGSAPVGTGPSTLAMNPATHTIYVANGYNDNGPDLPVPGNTVSVINARDCQAQDVSRCKGPWPTITVGDMPSGIAIDTRTDTVYVTNVQDNTVSVFNGATCNAENATGCGQTPATVPVGLDPLGLIADPADHTVYVPNFGGVAVGGPAGDSTTVSMIDSATCNATDLAACPTTPPPTVDVGSPPDVITVDQTTHTAYVGTLAGTDAFDASTCNATVQSGCGTIATLALGDPSGGPNGLQVDPANDTLYTANYDTTVSAFDLHDCNAADLAGCATDAPGTVSVPGPGFGDHALWLAVDAPLHSVYVVFQKDDALKVIDTNLCSGSEPAGCATLIAPEVHTGGDPESVILDPRTQTLYTANWVDNDVSVIDATRCNAQTVSGCVHRPPAVNLPGPGGLAVDAAVHTTYVTTGSNAVSMINTSRCNASRAGGCATTPPTVAVGDTPVAIAIDRRTDTVYVANYGIGATGTVSVLNARTCNATYTAGCASLKTLQVSGGNPDDVVVDPATETLFVATIAGSGPNRISVYNAATCNAANTLGCGQTPASLEVGDSGNGFSALSVAVNDATNTLYATNLLTGGNAAFTGSSVYMIDTATCDATNNTGCGQTPAVITLPSNNPAGATPIGIAIDQATNTIYTADVSVGEYPGTVGVINGASCDSQDTTGCSQTPATVATGFGTEGVAIDPTTHTVYVNNIQDTSVSIIDGTTCNRQDHTGCRHTPPKIAVGDYPGAAQDEIKQVANSSEPVAIDPAAETAYVQDIEGVSVIPLSG